MRENIDQGGSARVEPEDSFNFFHDGRVRSIFYQLLTAAIVGWLVWFLVSNTAQNLETRGMSTGFGFLTDSAAFAVDFKLIPYQPGIDTYGRVLLLGIINTLYISAMAILVATLMGFFVGVLRLSSNWLVSKVALAYVEIFRNTPLLIQIVFWYVGVFALMPAVKNTLDLSGGVKMIMLNSRGLYVAWPVPGDMFWLTPLALGVAIIAVIILRRWAYTHREQSGAQKPVLVPSLALLILLPAIAFVATGMPISWDMPTLEGFNYTGGRSVPPAFLALLVSLSIYHSAQIAEAVRAGILSVNRGQTDAALSIGLKPKRVLSLVIIPQAMPAIVPPLISQWMNIVKNSSLAVAIGYSDIVAVFMGTSLNQAGHAVEIVAITMAFYASISLGISGLLNIYNKRVQLVER
ncbi:Glutamate Aspartate transport system permease protein GltJ (TC 3.A.1.3.4) [hydrothermal vent metagenome]|uniref:Glutamate Aspartate transport system permease protein GltJ (TC 3.A.1.3.4) n=1 Tax=hydrothermal vent metagenome TaxID=652676 RepID=A0A3B0UAC8_9ZZZZ